MRRANRFDRVIVEDGREATVTDAAEFDNLLRVEYADGSSDIILQSQVAYNKSEVEFARQTSDLLIDYTFLPA